jgi:hypothetical protein
MSSAVELSQLEAVESNDGWSWVEHTDLKPVELNVNIETCVHLLLAYSRVDELTSGFRQLHLLAKANSAIMVVAGRREID